MNNGMKTALIIGGVVLVLLVVLPLIWGAVSGGQGYGYGMMGPGMTGSGMMGTGMMGGFGWTGLASVFWIIILGLIIWGIVALVRGLSQFSSADSGSSRPDSALEILKKRYARGEINKEEFDEKKKELL